MALAKTIRGPFLYFGAKFPKEKSSKKGSDNIDNIDNIDKFTAFEKRVICRMAMKRGGDLRALRELRDFREKQGFVHF